MTGLPSSGKKPLITAFKTNALFPNQTLDRRPGKTLYVETATHYFLYRK